MDGKDGMVVVAQHSVRSDRVAFHVALPDRLGSQMGRYVIQ